MKSFFARYQQDDCEQVWQELYTLGPAVRSPDVYPDAEAVAQEQVMRAKVEENRAKVVLAEAEIPLAIAQAFRDGKLGVMDYYNLRNVQSDTEMRNSIATIGSRKDRGTERPLG